MIKKFLCKHWFKRHKYYRLGTLTWFGVTQEVWVCKRCGELSERKYIKLGDDN